MEAIEAIKTRRSVRSYLEKRIEKKLIEETIDCARLAPSANNIQPWEFIVVTEKETREEIAFLTDYGKFIRESPVCICVFCRDTKYWLEDGCAATQNILIAANALGLSTCWVAGAKKPYAEKVRELLGVPKQFHLVSLIPLGYSERKPIPYGKRTLDQVLHWERF